MDFDKQTSRPTAKHRDGPGPGAYAYENKTACNHKNRRVKSTAKTRKNSTCIKPPLAIEKERKSGGGINSENAPVIDTEEILRAEHVERATHLLRQIELEPAKEKTIEPSTRNDLDLDSDSDSDSNRHGDHVIDSNKDKNNVDNDDFCFLAGGWDPKPDNGEQNESVVSLDPAAMLSLKKNVGTHLSIDQATVALGKFVDALFNRSLNAFQTNKAAEQWCVCRGMPASKGSVVLAVARHLKDVVSPHNRRERNLEISQRLEQTFPTEATEATESKMEPESKSEGKKK